MECNYTFPIDFAPNLIPFGDKSNGSVPKVTKQRENLTRYVISSYHNIDTQIFWHAYINVTRWHAHILTRWHVHIIRCNFFKPSNGMQLYFEKWHTLYSHLYTYIYVYIKWINIYSNTFHKKKDDYWGIIFSERFFLLLKISILLLLKKYRG